MLNWEKQAMEKYKIPSLLLMERAAQKVVEELMSGSYELKNILKAIWWDKTGITLEKALKMLEAANSIIQNQQKEITDQQIKIDAQKVLIQKKEEELSKTQTEINQINRVIDKKKQRNK